jgi:LPS-assembly lipoprotein
MVAKGSRNISSSIDVPRQQYAALRAENDAQQRAARELAQLLRFAIAQDFVREGKK